MKHLKTYNQIFEAKLGPELNDTIWTYLTGMVTFHELYVNHYETWVALIDLYEWKHLDEEQKSITRKEYLDYTKRYEGVEGTQKNFNFFVAYINGDGDWYHYDDEPIGERSIEWYMEEFGQDRSISSMMKAIASESSDPLDPGFTSIK
jgi:hypothetical protein